MFVAICLDASALVTVVPFPGVSQGRMLHISSHLMLTSVKIQEHGDLEFVSNVLPSAIGLSSDLNTSYNRTSHSLWFHVGSS